MAHFAKLDDDGNVLEVHVVANAALDPTDEEGSGVAFLTDWSGGYTLWKQTSYHTRGGVHYDSATGEPSADQSKALRKNYAGTGFIYDAALDAFIPPQPYPSWVLNPDTALWDAPVPMPSGGGPWRWDEESLSWVEVQPLT